MPDPTQPPRQYAGFRLEITEQKIAVITLDRPGKLNGFTAAMKRDLIEALFQLQGSSAARAVVFTGANGAFCAGDDIGAYYQDGAGAVTPPVPSRGPEPVDLAARLRSLSQRVNAAVRDLDLPTIAAIDGACIQSGLSLALACDFRIAAPDARLGSATLRFGFQPDENGHYLLVQHIGVARTLDFLLRKRIVSGAQALEWGLVHEVADDSEVLARALELAQELARGPQAATRLLKRAIYNAADMTFAQAGEDIATKTAISDHDPDTKEGVAAFRERREPRFR